MFNNLEMQARIYFFLNYLSDYPEATNEEALDFSERCWGQFQADTRESWLAEIRALLKREGVSAAPRERSPFHHVSLRSASANYARV